MQNEQRRDLNTPREHDVVIVLRKYIEWAQAKGTNRMKALAEAVKVRLDRGERVEAMVKDSTIRLAINLGGETYQNNVSFRFDENAIVVIENVEEISITY
jgi:hypothetical protein